MGEARCLYFCTFGENFDYFRDFLGESCNVEDDKNSNINVTKEFNLHGDEETCANTHKPIHGENGTINENPSRMLISLIFKLVQS